MNLFLNLIYLIDDFVHECQFQFDFYEFFLKTIDAKFFYKINILLVDDIEVMILKIHKNFPKQINRNKIQIIFEKLDKFYYAVI